MPDIPEVFPVQMDTEDTFHMHFDITKVDPVLRQVTGRATAQQLDKQADVVDYEGSKEAFGAWAGNIREMHQPKAVGKAVNIVYDDPTQSVFVTSHISAGAQDTWEKILDGTLTGYSIGGKTKQVEKGEIDGKPCRRVLKYDLSELSLVDSPALHTATFTLIKSEQGVLSQTDVVEDPTASTNTPADLPGGAAPPPTQKSDAPAPAPSPVQAAPSASPALPPASSSLEEPILRSDPPVSGDDLNKADGIDWDSARPLSKGDKPKFITVGGKAVPISHTPKAQRECKKCGRKDVSLSRNNVCAECKRWENLNRKSDTPTDLFKWDTARPIELEQPVNFVKADGEKVHFITGKNGKKIPLRWGGHVGHPDMPEPDTDAPDEKSAAIEEARDMLDEYEETLTAALELGRALSIHLNNHSLGENGMASARLDGYALEHIQGMVDDENQMGSAISIRNELDEQEQRGDEDED
jgi:hypothetical protein